MGIFSQIRGEAKNWVCKVWPVGPKNENSLFVNIAGLTPGVAIPTQSGVSKGVYDRHLRLNGTGSDNMLVDGSVTPQVFKVDADPSQDIVIRTLTFIGIGSGIKLGNFLSKNQPLTNGLSFSWRSDGVLFDFGSLPDAGSLSQVKSTAEFGRWAQVPSFTVLVEAGGDLMLAARDFDPAIVLRKQGTHGVDDDYLSVTINDNLTSGITELEAYVRGDFVTAGSV